MHRLNALPLALALATALLGAGCGRENPPSTTADGPPDSAPAPVPTPTEPVPQAAAPTGTDPAPNTPQGAIQPQGSPLAGGTSAPPPSLAGGASEVNPSELSLVDQNFLTTAAASGLLEMTAAKAADDRATRAEIRAYAKTLVDDHAEIHADLRALAARKNLSLPTEIGAGQTPTLEALLNARGDDFDRMFLQTLGISEHRSSVALFEKATREASDADVKAFAAKALPTLREHLATAQKLAGSGTQDS